MATNLLDRVRQEARARRQRLDLARAALQALTDDERELIYVELESDVEASARSRAEAGADRAVEQRLIVSRPKFTDLAERALRDNPQGLRTVEVAKRIGHSVPCAFGTLKCLEEQGRAERHGRRATALWTLPGGKPSSRVESIFLAIGQSRCAAVLPP